MHRFLIPILGAFILQGAVNLMAQPAPPEAPASIDPDAQYVLGPDSQVQVGVGGRSY